MTGPQPAMAATALVVDLRNFTPNLAAAPEAFSTALAEIGDRWLHACVTALPAAVREDPPLVVGSTGDGIIAAFLDPEHHYRHGFLAALLLQGTLLRAARAYAATAPPGVPTLSFGIGVESGDVRLVSAARGGLRLATVVGSCINVAARAEAVTKQLDRTHTIVGIGTTIQLVRSLFAEDYRALMDDGAARDDDEYLSRQRKMELLNDRLCLTYLQRHNLRGVGGPLALFKVSLSAARPGVRRFDELVRRLVGGDAEHCAEVLEALSRG